MKRMVVAVCELKPGDYLPGTDETVVASPRPSTHNPERVTVIVSHRRRRSPSWNPRTRLTIEREV